MLSYQLFLFLIMAITPDEMAVRCLQKYSENYLSPLFLFFASIKNDAMFSLYFSSHIPP